MVQSWDCAFKVGRENDYSVCTTWLTCEAGYYLLSLWRDRVEFPALKRQVISQAAAWKPHAIIVEDSASGQSLIQELRTTQLPILPIKGDSDKVSRAQAVTPLIESGRVFLPQSAGWLQDFMDELASFPKAAHDDCVDSLTQALNYLRLNHMPSCMYVVTRGSILGSAGTFGSVANCSGRVLPFPDAPEDPKEWFSGGILNHTL